MTKIDFYLLPAKFQTGFSWSRGKYGEGDWDRSFHHQLVDINKSFNVFNDLFDNLLTMSAIFEMVFLPFIAI